MRSATAGGTRRTIRPRTELHWALAWLWRRRPTELPLITDPHGRPALAGSPLRFGVDRAADHLMIAISRTQPVGVCLHPPADDVDEQAQLWLSPKEHQLLGADKQTSARAANFARLMTRKRAALRLLGWQPPTRVREVRTVTHNADHGVMTVPGLGAVTVRDLPAGDGVLASVATHPDAGGGIAAFTADYGLMSAWGSGTGGGLSVVASRHA